MMPASPILSRSASQRGLVQWLACAVTLVMGLLSIHAVQMHLSTQRLQQSQETTEQQSLNAVRAYLLQFAASQGSTSLRDAGNLPCPSKTPNGTAQVECLDQALGYLPTLSHVATNYFNTAVPHALNQTSSSTAWHYAVSEQLIQPNALGWSQKVNWDRAALSLVFRPQSTPIKAIAAVVARKLTPTDHGLEVSQPAVWISVDDLQTAILRNLTQQMHHTLSLLPKTLPMEAFGNFIQINEWPAQPMNPKCQCRCTKTRCQCGCAQTALWMSPQQCWGHHSNCKNIEPNPTEISNPSGWPHNWDNTPWVQQQLTQTNPAAWCQSEPNQPCWFAGAAGLLNNWPVSAYQPAATLGRSCRPEDLTLCPVSSENSPCHCQFGWPEAALGRLHQIKLNHVDKNWRVQTP